MAKASSQNAAESEVIALNALRFLASDETRLERFLALTGHTLATIRKSAADPSFLAGVLDHVLQDQTLLLLFAEAEGMTPDSIVRARRLLPGAPHDF